MGEWTQGLGEWTQGLGEWTQGLGECSSSNDAHQRHKPQRTQTKQVHSTVTDLITAHTLIYTPDNTDRVALHSVFGLSLLPVEVPDETRTQLHRRGRHPRIFHVQRGKLCGRRNNNSQPNTHSKPQRNKCTQWHTGTFSETHVATPIQPTHAATLRTLQRVLNRVYSLLIDILNVHC